MRFEIPFEADIHRNQSQLIFEQAWKESLAKNKLNLVAAISFLTFGTLMIFMESVLGYILLSVGLFYLLNVVNNYSFFKKSKRDYFEVYNRVSSRLTASNASMAWAFLESYFYYKDPLVEAKMSWETVKRMRVVNDNLILDIQYGNPAYYALGMEEVGDENFSRIKAFVQEKIQNHTL